MNVFALVLLCAVAFSFTLKAKALETSAVSATLYCPQTEQFLYEKNAHQRMGCASTTKILTALVVLENMTPEQKVTIPAKVCGIEGSSLYLQEGEVLSVRDLLYALMLRSANDCAAALAVACCGSIEAFAEKMNETAVSVGAKDSHFENPHGLDGENHYTTAHDLAIITAAALENPLFCEIVCTKSHTIDAPEGKRVLTNHNKLLWRYEGAVGVKTGFTKKCGRCLVGAAERDGVRMIAVTLKASNDWNDHRTLFDFGFERVENRLLADAGQISFDTPLIARKAQSILLCNPEPVYAILPKDAAPPTMQLEIIRPITAPVKKGEVLGTVYFTLDGRVVASTSLVAQNAISK